MISDEKKSISQLEGWEWNSEIPNKNNSSYEEYNFYILHLKPLRDYSIEDLYFMIGQESGLKFFIPIAIDLLSEDLFLKADDYPGDLLQRVLFLEKPFWERNHKLYMDLFKLTKDINLPNPELPYFINNSIKKSLNYFNELNIK